MITESVHKPIRASARRIPWQSQLFTAGSTAYYADSYEIPLERHDLSAAQLYRHVVMGTPPWINSLMRLREKLAPLIGVRRVGLLGSGIDVVNPNADISVGQKMDIFTVRSVSDTEVIVGEDDSHLDFRLSLLKIQEDGTHKLVLSMTVDVNNFVGVAYLKLILPFHKLIMKEVLNRSLREKTI